MPRAAAVVLLLLAACSERPALAFRLLHVKVDHDGFELRDVALGDPDRDGDVDLVVATEADLRWLAHERGGWSNETAGTGLAGLAAVERLHADGPDLLAERGGRLVRLVASDIGTWTEAEGPVPDRAPDVALSLAADLDGDGLAEQVRADGNRLVVTAATGQDLTALVGLEHVSFPAPVRRLLVADLDGDGDLDLLVVASRLFALLSNGGHLPRPPASAAVARPASAPAASPAPWFRDVTAESGLHFTHREGGEQWDIRPTMGPGAAFADLDVDGDADLYVPGGREQQGVLFINDGRGAFSESAAAWGLHDVPPGAGMGALCADWDEDGDPDLYVTRDGPNVMLRNDGGRFADVTTASGTGDARWGASAATADADRDGDLDLFVTNYIAFDPSRLPPDERRREDPLAMLPYVFDGQADLYYRNEGGLRFVDATEAAGLLAPEGKGLGVVFADVDEDLWPDLYVANDTTPNTLWRNLGEGRFEERALLVGLDDPRGSMGLALADLDADADEELLVSNWQVEANALYRSNLRHGATTRRFVPAFEDIALAAGLARPSVGYVGWGCLLADLDGDGDHDAFVVNGYTSPDYETTMLCVGQPDHLFRNVSGPGPFASQAETPRWELVPPSEAGAWAERALPGRGLAAADVDGDGDLDLAITVNNGPLSLLRNERGGRFLQVLPEGRAPRDAVGARVTAVLDDGRRPVALVRSGEGYLGCHERGVRVGLGEAAITGVEVVWPDGSRSTHAATGPGRLVVRQP